MKLGIITFYCSHNYGAMLQTYGLQEYLRSLGHDVYIIDFKPDYKIKQYKRSSARYWLSRNPKMCIRRLIDYIRSKKKRNKRWDRFHSFMLNHFDLYPYHTGMDFHEFDAVFIGSDQVWSPYHTGGWFDDLMFGVDFKCKTISYAPSCTSTCLSEEQKNYFRTHLDMMTAISVREDSFKDVLQPFTRHNISVVLDPTLLAGDEVFNKIATPMHIKNPYVVVYEIARHTQVRAIAEDIAKQLNADIIELTNSVSNLHNDPSVLDDASPSEFLGIIKNAACIVTTSFHGTAFSLLFQRPFYVVKQGTAADNRMISLMNKLGIQDRLVSMNDKLTMSILDYSSVNAKLAQLVADSEDFINNSLKL